MCSRVYIKDKQGTSEPVEDTEIGKTEAVAYGLSGIIETEEEEFGAYSIEKPPKLVPLTADLN